jgi:phosphatidylserine/phosphatidylglycerophosphate/cardiolipin synthase-like enzyme
VKHLLAALLLCLTVGAGATPLPATGTVEVLFTPWDDAEGAIVRALGEARESIHVQAYLLTSRSIARALQEAKARGVRGGDRGRPRDAGKERQVAAAPACRKAASRSGWKPATPRPTTRCC